MFTDGTTIVGQNASILAQQAKDSGIAIYCIGLTRANGVDVNALNQWASGQIVHMFQLHQTLMI